MSPVRVAPRKRPCRRLDGVVAGLVPVGVVDGLEPVEVDEQQHDGRVVAAGAGQFLVDSIERGFPVQQAGQPVAGRDLVQSHPLALGLAYRLA